MTVMLPGLKEHFVSQVGRFKSDGVTERLCRHQFSTLEALEDFLRSNIRVFANDGSSAALCLLYSVIMTRGMDQVRGDSCLSNNIGDQRNSVYAWTLWVFEQ